MRVSRARAMETASAAPVDRAVTTPFLLRVYVGHSFSERDFEGRAPASELHLYTWRDATLRELAELIKGVDESARTKDQDLFFSIVVRAPALNRVS